MVLTGSVYAADPSIGPSSQPSGQSGVWYAQALDVSKTQTFEVTYDGNKKLTINVPSGTFSEPVTMFANKITTGGSPATTGLKLASYNWDFRAERPSDGKEFKTFSKKVKISIPFDTSVSGEKSIYYKDPTKWVKLATTVNGGTATTEVDHFTEFAVLAGGTSSTTATPNVGGVSTNVSWPLVSLIGLTGIASVGLRLRKN